mmetsp:Transcript_9725/g.27814  ORF Transcript_9725/g.27814 Transcript_9725/m.27814 type:complete len:214 (+) Transcript_9725:678-1319(+)
MLLRWQYAICSALSCSAAAAAWEAMRSCTTAGAVTAVGAAGGSGTRRITRDVASDALLVSLSGRRSGIKMAQLTDLGLRSPASGWVSCLARVVGIATRLAWARSSSRARSESGAIVGRGLQACRLFSSGAERDPRSSRVRPELSWMAVLSWSSANPGFPDPPNTRLDCDGIVVDGLMLGLKTTVSEPALECIASSSAADPGAGPGQVLGSAGG